MRRVSRILIVGPSWVGDMVMAQSLFKVLKQQQPAAQIDVLAPPWSRPITAAMPEVRRSIDMTVGHGRLDWSARRALGEQLAGHYDQALVLPNSWKSALVPFFADIPKRTGWRGEWRYGLLNDIRLLSKSRYPLMVQRFNALADPPGADPRQNSPAPELLVPEAELESVRVAFGLSLDAPVLALCPGAEFGQAKQWPPEHYATLAENALQQGFQVWLLGSEKDQTACEEIRRSCTQGAPVTDFSGRTTLNQALALLALSDRVVSNDSGLMHVASALHKPLVAVYGSTSPEFTPPLGGRARVVRPTIECSPCFDRVCRFGHYRCLKELHPDRVQAALHESAEHES